MSQNPERRRDDGDAAVEQRSTSSLVFQSLDALGDVGVGTGTTLLGLAALKKVTGSEAPAQQSPPPAAPPPTKQSE
jgi:hypothetical protein